MTDSPEGIEAGKIYQRFLTKTAPPGIAGFNWYECQAAFLQGKVGMWLDGIGFAPPGEDPAKSRIVGKIGYGVMPKGPKIAASATFGDGLAVPAAATTKKEAAYLYCQWGVSKLLGIDPCLGLIDIGIAQIKSPDGLQGRAVAIGTGTIRFARQQAFHGGRQGRVVGTECPWSRRRPAATGTRCCPAWARAGSWLRA